MLRRILVVVAMLIAAFVWYSVNMRDDPAVAVLKKLDRLMDGGTLDYAAATEFLGTPLDALKFEMLVNGNTINARSGEYHIGRKRGNPPGFDHVGLDMAWLAESGGPTLRAWHTDKGLRSHLKLSLDTRQICITKWMLWLKFGWVEQTGSSHGNSVSLSFGDRDRLSASFTFDGPECAGDLSVRAKNPAADWPVPADASARDPEFVTRFLPLDKSGGQFDVLGLKCGPADSASSKPEDTGCVCEWEKQTPAGPCHYSVNLSALKEGGLKVGVWALPDREAR
jgi:hypothetical protein